MNEMLKQMQVMEKEMEEVQEKAEYWLQDEHFDEEKAGRFEKEADGIYENLYSLFDKAAEKIVRTTSSQIDKVTAMTMIRCRRSEVERIFA